MINKFAFIKGGVERYLFELKNILESKGHEVSLFSMKDKRNFESDYEDYFVNNIDYNSNGRRKIAKSISQVSKLFYSFEAKSKIARLIEKVKPDIAHIHMIDHQISPSVLHVLKKYDIPTIQTMHHYKLVCPNYKFYIPHKNEVCERCLGGSYYHAILTKCHKNSFVASTLVSMETYFHKMMNIYEDNIDIFHCPSRFMASKLKEGGIPEQKIRHLILTIDTNAYACNSSFDNYFLYYGRLSDEKGILTLLKAMKNIQSSKLVIVGEGPQKDLLMKYAENNLNNVEFYGALHGRELQSVIANSMFVVMPSQWYENSPLVIYESFSLGKPVIGARIGGIPEFIDHGENGLLFEPGDINELEKSILFLLNNTSLIVQFGNSARRKAEKLFGHETHYRNITRLYNEILH